MTSGILDRMSEGIKRVEKAGGAISLVISAVTTAVNRGQIFTYVFVGVLVFFATTSLLRFGGFGVTTRATQRSDRAGVRRWVSIVAVVGLYVGIGVWSWWIITRPGLEITDVFINEDAAIERLLADYPPVVTRTLDLPEAVTAFEAGVAEAVDHVNAKLFSGEAVSLSPAQLTLVLRNRIQKPIVVTGVDLEVYAATWFGDCLAFGEGLPVLDDPVQVLPCPFWMASELPLVADRRGNILAEVAGGDTVRQVVRLRNNGAPECQDREPLEDVLAVAVYEVEVSVTYGGGRTASYSKRVLVSVPTIDYALGAGHTGFETTGAFNQASDCQSRSLTRTAAFFERSEIDELEAGRRALQYAEAVRAAIE